MEVRPAIELYLQGWFPMGESRDGPVEWVQPMRRCVLPLAPGEFRIKRSLRQLVNRLPFDIRCDTSFDQVIAACRDVYRGAEVGDQCWIAAEIVELFRAFHRVGLAHSVEAWTREPTPRLVGGLYGLALGGVFCGESMFSTPDDGGSGSSQVCLVHLVGHLRRCGFQLLDSQISNEHVEQFGTRDWEAEDYVAFVQKFSVAKVPWLSWSAAEALRAVPELRRAGTMGV